MNKTIHNNRKSTRISPPLWRKSALATCILAASAPVVAQQESAVEEIVVTGMRESLRSAQDIKRLADTFVDGITALDIGALPDRSVLEAMQRIPGVSIERIVSGWPDYFSVEGRSAVIRGMSATRSEFNGREAFHADGRGLSFADVPPELMGGVDIYKNQTADMIEGGIGGTVNLRTRKPFDSPERLVGVTAEGNWGDLSEEWNPSVSALYSDRWETSAGHEFGFLINVQDSERAGTTNGAHINAYLPRPASVIPGAERFVGDGTGTVYMPEGMHVEFQDAFYDRTGLTTSFQWRDSENKYQFTGEYIRQDAAYIYYKNWIRDQRGASRTTFNTRPPAGATPWEFNDQGVFQKGILSHANFGWRAADLIGPGNSEPNTRWPNPYAGRPSGPGQVGGMADFGGRYNVETERTISDRRVEDASLNFRWTPNEAWTVDLDYQHVSSWSTANLLSMHNSVAVMPEIDLTGDKPRITFIEPWNGERDNNKEAYLNGVFRPGWTDDPLGDANYFQDPTSYYNHSVWDLYNKHNGKSDAFRVDVNYAMDDSVITDIKGGVRWNERSQNGGISPVSFGGIAPNWSNGALYMDHDPRDFYQLYDWSDHHRGDVLDIQGGNQTLGFSRDYIDRMLKDPTCPGDPDHLRYSQGGYWIPNLCRAGIDSEGYLPSERYDTVETASAAYVRLDFAFDNLPRRVAGNIGLRYVELERDATGFVRSPSVDLDFSGTPRDLPANQTAPLSGPGVLNYAQAQVAAGNYPDLDTFYAASENQWVREAFWYLSDEERAFATEASGHQSRSFKTDFLLPSLNVKVELTPNLLGRFAVSKALAMPSMGDIRNRITTSAQIDTIVGEPADVTNAALWETAIQSAQVDGWTGSGGNADLLPMESVQWDASLEWYFAAAGSLTGTLFYKDLSNFFVYGSTPRDVTNAATGVTQQVLVESRTNGKEGKMKGYELAYQQFYDRLPSPFDGFGVQANYTWIEASGVPPEVPLTHPDHWAYAPEIDLTSVGLAGQSEHTANLVLMYEKYDWSARLAYNWRSEYLVTYRDGFTHFPVWLDDAGVLDASVTYNLNDNVSFVLQATNLLDTMSETFFIVDNDGTRAKKSWFIGDRQLVLGTRIRF